MDNADRIRYNATLDRRLQRWTTLDALGLSLHTELELLTQAGLSPREALAAATTNFAEICGWRAVGRVAPGAHADLLVLRGNPARRLAEASAIELMFVGGELLDRDRLLGNAPRGAGPGSSGAPTLRGRSIDRGQDQA